MNLRIWASFLFKLLIAECPPAQITSSLILNNLYSRMNKETLKPLIDFESGLITLSEINGRSKIARRFGRISLAGEPVSEYFICLECRALLANCLGSHSNLYRHLELHDKDEKFKQIIKQDMLSPYNCGSKKKTRRKRRDRSGFHKNVKKHHNPGKHHKSHNWHYKYLDL